MNTESNSNAQTCLKFPSVLSFSLSKERLAILVSRNSSYPVSKNNTIAHHVTLPFQKFNLSQLPSNIKKAYEINWKPIFNMMEEVLNVEQFSSSSASYLSTQLMN